MRTAVFAQLSFAQDLFLSRTEADSTCSVYDTGSGNCEDCGSCFNGGGRSGAVCKGQSTGYFCASDSPAEGADMAFACMDWTFGSVGMRAAEGAFNKRTGDNVRMGVGTYGTSDDPQRGLGACYRMQISGMDKPLIVQSINTGSDVTGNQFDLQIGDGGAGAFNTCAGGKQPGVDTMYPGAYDASTWGKQYGGVDNKAQCQGLPKYPAKDAAMKSAGDDLVTLCEYGFDNGARQEGGGNPSIQSIARVKCPAELVELTQMQRNDDPSEYTAEAPVEAAHECEAGSGGSLAWCLTRMMDCRKPSGGFKDNVKAEIMVDGKRIVQPCLSDGYTRIDVQCGCSDCYC